MVLTPLACPDSILLPAFSLGNLPQNDLDRLDDHLTHCVECQRAIGSLDHAADGFLRQLREAACTPLTKLPERCAQVLAEAAESASTAARLRQLPRQLRDYQLEESLGQGGMGRVFKALHANLKKQVAVKVLLADRIDDPSAVARLRREMEAVGRLDHPNIVRAHDAGEAEGHHFLVMEYVDGLDCAELARRMGPLAWQDACELARQAATGLAYAHQYGLVHRDIKPSNLMLAADGHVKLLDLGLALLTDKAARGELSACREMMGTADYIAPEQIFDSHTVDARADIYSLGCTLYRLLAGAAPFGGTQYGSRYLKLKAHEQETPPRIDRRRPELPAALADVIERMLAKRPDARYSSMGEVAAALTPFAAGADLVGLASRARVVGDLPPRAQNDRTLDETNRGGGGEASTHGRRPRPASGVDAAPSPPDRRAGGKRGWLPASMVGLSLLSAAVLVPLARQWRETPVAAVKVSRSAEPTATTWLPNPEQQAFFDRVASLAPNEQVAAIRQRLVEANSEFDGQLDATVEDGRVAGLRWKSDVVSAIWPVRALVDLRFLTCEGENAGQLKDLTPLAGLRLTELNCPKTAVVDLSPLAGMPLRVLRCYSTGVADLSPLKGMKLKELDCNRTAVFDLSPLAGMPLKRLEVGDSRVSDLSPLANMPLKVLNCFRTPVSDLSPLAGMALNALDCNGTSVSDLSPLANMPLKVLQLFGAPVSDLSPLAGMALSDLDCNASSISDLSPLANVPLMRLSCRDTVVSDFSPLAGLPLVELTCDENTAVRNAELLSRIKSLRAVNGKPAKELWPYVSVKAAPDERIIDDGNVGYSETGEGWIDGTLPLEESHAFGQAYRVGNKGALQARWAFPPLPPGEYEVFTTWSPHDNHASSAAYSLFDAETLLRVTQIDQRQPPGGMAAADAGRWRSMGHVNVKSGKFVVELDATRSIGGSVVADAIRVVPVQQRSE